MVSTGAADGTMKPEVLREEGGLLLEDLLAVVKSIATPRRRTHDPLRPVALRHSTSQLHDPRGPKGVSVSEDECECEKCGWWLCLLGAGEEDVGRRLGLYMYWKRGYMDARRRRYAAAAGSRMILTLDSSSPARSLSILTSLSFPSRQKNQVLSTSQPAGSPHRRARAGGMQGCCAYLVVGPWKMASLTSVVGAYKGV
jgi:hypothetical protein